MTLIARPRQGMVIVIVLVALTSSLIFAAFLMDRSVKQGYEKIVTRERTQLELLCHAALEAAKLKIKAAPTELYAAFRFKFDEPAATRTNALYEAFLADLRLEVLDVELASESVPMTARVTSIERLGITKKGTGLSTGYVEDYLRITASASSLIAGFSTGKELKNDVVMQVTMQITKLEGQ